MGHFRGTVRGNNGEASRLGAKANGVVVEAQSWEGKIVTTLWYDTHIGVDMARVCLELHHGAGLQRTIYYGPVSGQDEKGELTEGGNRI